MLVGSVVLIDSHVVHWSRLLQQGGEVKLVPPSIPAIALGSAEHLKARAWAGCFYQIEELLT